MRLLLIATAALALSPIATASSAQSTLAAAVADTANRTPDNVKLDESRKPAQLLQFFGLKSGMQVLDVFGANKYWSEIMGPVVGPKGHVTVWQPTQFLTDKNRGPFEEFAGKAKNVSLISSPFEAPDLPAAKFDFALINMDYHDTYWESAERKIPRQDPNAWLKRSAAQPGRRS